MGKQSYKGFGDDKYKRFGDLKIVQSLMMKGEISEAEKILLSIKSKKGLDHIGFYLLANICRIKSKHLLALEFLQNSIKLNPLYADALSDIGAIYIEINNLNLAKKYLHKSLEINSDKLSSNINTGILYRKLGNIQLALKYFSKALEIDSNNSNLNFSIGQIYDGLGDFKQAIFYYRKSVSLDQKNGNAFLGLYTVYLRTCAWQSIANINSRLINFGTQFFEGGQPLALLFHDDDPYKQKMRAINHFNHHFKRRVVMPKFTKNKKIRLGYISNNFVIHPVSFLIEKVIELHNRSEFEIYAYSINPIEDEVTKKFYRLFDVFRNISKVNDDNAYKIIKEDNIDILIDLMGYTPGSRMGIISRRAAPIQINYLAYPATSGSDQIDYILSDKNVIPFDMQKFYTEKVLYLPGTFICFNDSTKVSKSLKKNPFLNLDQSFFIMVAFHRVAKMSQSTVDAWIKIMNEIQDSYLWLKKTNKYATKNLLNYFESKNVNSSRIIFADREELYEDHLARYSKGDLLLDTFLYNGHTTTIEALWSGLPVITLEGNSLKSRVSSSILKSIGLDELIAKNKDEYIDKVIFYSRNKSELHKLKIRLKNLKKKGNLFNTLEFVRNYETVLKKIILGNKF